jgi:hypothetical protein
LYVLKRYSLFHKPSGDINTLIIIIYMAEKQKAIKHS